AAGDHTAHGPASGRGCGAAGVRGRGQAVDRPAGPGASRSRARGATATERPHAAGRPQGLALRKVSGLTSAPEMLAGLLAGLLLSAAPEAVEQARTDFERGAALYRAGSYREALAAFEEAQARSPAPQNLFNIARCHERLGEFVDAVEAYRAYLDAAPQAP